MLTKTDIMQLIGMAKVHYSFNYKNFSDNDYIILRDSWYDDLKEYSKEIVFKAFNEAKKVNKIAITTADIIGQIERMKAAFEPSKDELWQQLIKKLPEVRHFKENLYIGKWNDETNKQEKEEYGIRILPVLFDHLHPILKSYLVNWQSLGKLSQLDDDDLKFEKGRFLKEFENYKDRVKYQQTCPQLESLVKNIGIKLIN